MNWINSWKKGNKKNKFEVTIRLGRITLLEVYYNPGREFKFLILNFGITLAILIFLALLPTTLLAQNSWINIQLLTDDFPTETSWNILGAYGDTIIQNGALDLNTLYDTIIEVEGDIVLNVVDAFGDGLGASQWNGTDGWVFNTKQLSRYYFICSR